MKNKGFTLIEIISVIIIIGVIMVIAVPSVSSYITNARKDTFIVSLTRYIEGARELVEGKSDISVVCKDVTYYIPKECIPVDKGSNSPYGEWVDVYVVVTYDGLKHYYYVTARDDTNTGVDLVYSDKLSVEKIRDKMTSVVKTKGIGSRHFVYVVGSNCTTKAAGGCKNMTTRATGTNLPDKG